MKTVLRFDEAIDADDAATLVGSRLCWTAIRAAALESGRAKPALKPITLSTPPARANQGDLRREAQAKAIARTTTHRTCRQRRRPAPTPTTDDATTWVVDTGAPTKEAGRITAVEAVWLTATVVIQVFS